LVSWRNHRQQQQHHHHRQIRRKGNNSAMMRLNPRKGNKNKEKQGQAAQQQQAAAAAAAAAATAAATAATATTKVSWLKRLNYYIDETIDILVTSYHLEMPKYFFEDFMIIFFTIVNETIPIVPRLKGINIFYVVLVAGRGL
jgi:hypothetical protein